MDQKTQGQVRLDQPLLNRKVAVRRRITDHLAVYMAELMAVLQWAEEVKPDSVVICSDSCAVFMSLQSFNSHGGRQGSLVVRALD